MCGQISRYEKINRAIHSFINYLSEEDQGKFRKKIGKIPAESNQSMHTLRELILGAYLCVNGFQARYEYSIDNQTPDWCILDSNSKIIGIVELTNFHIDKATEIEIRSQCKLKKNFAYWRDGNKNNVSRLYQCIEGKALAYRSRAISLEAPYVVAVFGEWEVAVDFDEICFCLLGGETGLFDIYPEMSGVLHFTERNALQYLFNYAENPNALKPIIMPTGDFPTQIA